MKSTYLLLATAVAIGSGVGLARADGETIAVFTKNQTNPFFQNVRVGAENARGSSAPRSSNTCRPSRTASPSR